MRKKRTKSFSSGEGVRDIISPELDDDHFRALNS
jgi:hypothetical protein